MSVPIFSQYVEKILKLREKYPHQAMTVGEYALVYLVAEKARPNRILEAGTGYGVSTRVLHEAAPMAKIDSIDFLTGELTTEEWGKFVEGVKNVNLIYGDSRCLIPKLVREKDYDLALLDDGHSEEIVFKNVIDTKSIPIVLVHNAFKEGILRALNRSGQTFKSYRFDPMDEKDTKYFSEHSKEGIGIWVRGFDVVIGGN